MKWINHLIDSRRYTKIGLRAELQKDSFIQLVVNDMVELGCYEINIKRLRDYNRIDGEMVIRKNINKFLKTLNREGWDFKEK